MSALSFDTRCKSFAKAQHRFDDCLIRQIVPDGLHSLVGSANFCGFGFRSLKLITIIYDHSMLHVNKAIMTAQQGGSRHSGT